MKKVLLVLVFSLVFSSCVSHNYLAGSYSSKQYVESKKTYDEVWNNVIDFFALSGISIQTIDKASGLIVADNVSFIDSYTREKDGVPIDKSAFVVISTVKDSFGHIYEPSTSKQKFWDISGSFSVRVKNDGVTKIYVNVNNLRCVFDPGKLNLIIPIQSTGVFEKELINSIKE